MQDLTHIKHIFFDLDHTLWDFERNSALAFSRVFEQHGILVDMHEFLRHYVPINQRYWLLYQLDKLSQEELRYGRLRDTFSLLEKPQPEEALYALSESYIEHLPVFNHLFEDTVDVLDYLHPKYTLHIITNGFSSVQKKKILNSGIGHFFTTVTDSEMAGVKKPDSRIFEFALAQAGALPNSSLMIGDSLEADVTGALNAGIKAIHFDSGATESDPGQAFDRITRLSQLKNQL